jgi:hypothetical protein
MINISGQIVRSTEGGKSGCDLKVSRLIYA